MSPSQSSPPRGLRETYARFFEDPSRDKLSRLLQENDGEFRNLDFKETWIEAEVFAKQSLAMFNTGGGALVVGVREDSDGSLEPVGLEKMSDKADLTNGIKKFLPSEVLRNISLHDFVYEASDFAKIAGMRFQVALIATQVDYLPAVAARAGSGIREAAIYVRREGRVEEASYSEVQALLNQRIEAGRSTAKDLDTKHHLSQLRALFEEIPQYSSSLSWLSPSHSGLLSMMGRTKNPAFPAEDFESFVSRMISAKKNLIGALLGFKEDDDAS